MLDEAIAVTEAAAKELTDAGMTDRATKLATSMGKHREKFFFKALVGVPLANKARKAAQAFADAGTDEAFGALESIVAQIDEKADTPDTVVT